MNTINEFKQMIKNILTIIDNETYSNDINCNCNIINQDKDIRYFYNKEHSTYYDAYVSKADIEYMTIGTSKYKAKVYQSDMMQTEAVNRFLRSNSSYRYIETKNKGILFFTDEQYNEIIYKIHDIYKICLLNNKITKKYLLENFNIYELVIMYDDLMLLTSYDEELSCRYEKIRTEQQILNF